MEENENKIVTVNEGEVDYEKEAKKAKVVKSVKTGLKVAGIALVGGIIGFICGKKSSKNVDDNDYVVYDSDENNEN